MNNIKKKILIVVGILAFFLGTLVYYFMFLNEPISYNDEDNNNEEIKVENKEEDLKRYSTLNILDMNPKFEIKDQDFINETNLSKDNVLKLYSILGQNMDNFGHKTIMYRESKYTPKKMKDSQRLSFAFSYLNNDDYENLELPVTNFDDNSCMIENKIKISSISSSPVFNDILSLKDNTCYVVKVSKNKLENIDLALFGNEINELSYPSEFIPLNDHQICKLIDDNYYCYSTSQLGWYGIPYSKRKIDKVVNEQDDIVVYDKYLYVYYNFGNSDVSDTYYYKEYDKLNLVKKVMYNENNDEDKIFDTYSQTYKHVFKKDDKGNYHWYSSEKYN